MNSIRGERSNKEKPWNDHASKNPWPHLATGEADLHKFNLVAWFCSGTPHYSTSRVESLRQEEPPSCPS